MGFTLVEICVMRLIGPKLQEKWVNMPPNEIDTKKKLDLFDLIPEG